VRSSIIAQIRDMQRGTVVKPARSFRCQSHFVFSPGHRRALSSACFAAILFGAFVCIIMVAAFEDGVAKFGPWPLSPAPGGEPPVRFPVWTQIRTGLVTSSLFSKIAFYLKGLDFPGYNPERLYCASGNISRVISGRLVEGVDLACRRLAL